MPSPSLLQRLKERKLVQWALAYLAGAFVVVQLLDGLETALGLSATFQQGTLSILGVGFFVVLVLAWYHGEKGRQRVSGPELLMVAALLVVAGVSLSVLHGGEGETETAEAVTAAPAEDDRPSIAVLPFQNRSGREDDVYFTDGMHDQIISQLTRISGLSVRGLTSVLVYRDSPKHLSEIGEELNARYLVEGGVQRAGGTVRINVQLIEAATDEHIWASVYDRAMSMDNLFSIQTEIVEAVTDSVRAVVEPEEMARVEAKPTESLQAYDLYFLGRSYWGQISEAGFERAIELFEQAIAVDPGFALAYAGIADSYALLTQGWGRPPLQTFPKVREAANEALRLDPNLPEALTSLGGVRLFFDWDMAGAETALTRAIELDPNYATAHHWLAISLMARGRHREALERIRRALALDPLSPYVNVNMGYLLYVAEDYEAAVDHYDHALQIFPDHPLLQVLRGVALAQQGRISEAIEGIERALEFSPDGTLFPLPYLGNVYGLAGREADARRILLQLHDLDREQFVSPEYFSIVHLGLGELDQAIEWLYKAEKARTDWALFIPVDPLAHSLHSDSRFVELVRAIGLGEVLR